MPAFLTNPLKQPWLRQCLKIMVSVALISYCITLIDIDTVMRTLGRVDYFYLSIAFLLTLLGTIVFKALVAWRLLSVNNELGFLKLLSINLALRFYTMILPKAIVTGIRWNKYRHISSKEMSLVLVSFEALLALTIAALATVIFAYLDGNPVIPLDIKIASTVLCVVFVALVFILFFSPNAPVVIRLVEWLSRHRRLGFGAKLLNKWREAAAQLGISDHRIFWPVFLLSTCGHLLFLLGGYLLFLSLSIDIHFTAVAWIRSAVFILVSVPISFAGIGIREVGFVALFGLYGMNADGAIAYAVLALLVQTAIGFMGMVAELKDWLSNDAEAKA